MAMPTSDLAARRKQNGPTKISISDDLELISVLNPPPDEYLLYQVRESWTSNGYSKITAGCSDDISMNCAIKRLRRGYRGCRIRTNANVGSGTSTDIAKYYLINANFKVGRYHGSLQINRIVKHPSSLTGYESVTCDSRLFLGITRIEYGGNSNHSGKDHHKSIGRSYLTNPLFKSRPVGYALLLSAVYSLFFGLGSFQFGILRAFKKDLWKIGVALVESPNSELTDPWIAPLTSSPGVVILRWR